MVQLESAPVQETEPAGPVSGHRVGHWRAGCAVALVAGLCYVNALSNEFALDDNDVIAQNPLVHQLSGVYRAFVHTYWPEATRAGQYRPLTIATFAIDWTMFRGSTVWLHAVNVLWHVAACLIVWRLLVAVVSRRGALAGGLVFAIHPVHVEAVANLVGRSELMCATFVLAALLAHRRGHWSAVPLYAAALLSKETGITLLGLVVASDVLIRAARQDRMDGERSDGGKTGGGKADGNVLPGWSRVLDAQTSRRRAGLYIAYASVTAAYGLLLASLFRDVPIVRVAAPWMRLPTSARWLTAISGVTEYARLLLIPLHLHVDYMPRAFDVVHRVTLPVILGVVLIVGAAVVAVRVRKSAPPIAFAIALFAITIAPVSNIFFASGIMLAERTLYLPSVALSIVVAWAWQQASVAQALRASDRRGSWSDRPWATRAAVIGAVALVAVGLAVRTWTRTPVWRNNKTALVASLRDEPLSYRAHERAADVLERAGNVPGALHEYAIARSLYPDDAYLYQASASMLVTRGDSGTAAASRLLDSARLIDPSPYADLMRHAWLRYAARDYPGTIALARSAYLMKRDSVDAIMVLTQAAQQINDVRSANAAFRLALADHPRDRSLHRSYAAMLMSVGDSAGAAREGQLAGRHTE
jgi:hypothetical protein